MKKAPDNLIHEAHNVHMVGIGGIGMSGLAKLFHKRGITVTGSDVAASRITQDLIDTYHITVNTEGSQLSHDSVINYDFLIYSPAVPENDPERTLFREAGIPEYSYPEALGVISREKKTITVSGTNGKTTTTTMLVEVLKHLNLDVSAIVGEILQKYGSNYIHGESEYFILEACEYKDSFLNLNHDIAVITNITEDHLDYFKDLVDIQESFSEYMDNKKSGGVLVCDISQNSLKPVIQHAQELGMKIVNYGTFLTEDLVVALPGKHNKQNAAAALAVVEFLTLDLPAARNYLATGFMGAQRRFEFVGTTPEGALMYDDYAHNPEGLSFLIDGMRTKFPNKKIVLLFEPHLYSRTRDFAQELAQELKKADELYLFPTYRAREQHFPDEDFLLAEYLNTTEVELTLIKSPESSELIKQKKYGDDTVIVTVGAGPIWKEGRSLVV